MHDLVKVLELSGRGRGGGWGKGEGGMGRLPAPSPPHPPRQNKSHLTDKGLEEIINIKSRMNSLREP